MRKIGQIDLKVTNRSGFDKSHRSLFTMECGTLYPILVDELIPNSTIHLKQLLQAQLPPLATDAFANVKVKTEAFFVPFRLLYGGFENWLMETPLRTPQSTGTVIKSQNIALSLDPSVIANAGSLCDFLGFKLPPDWDSSEQDAFNVNIYPFLAYGRIYDDWYRNSLVQAPLFQPALRGTSVPSSVGQLPSQMFSVSKVFDGTGTLSTSSDANGYYCDGSYITDLRQRNFGLDYFTGSQPSAQRGNARSVSMTVANNQASFTIASLRAQNSLQIFCERNNFSYAIEDYNLINYGAHLHRGMATRPVYLGGQSMDVYSKTVYQTASDSNASNNPFDTTGAKFADARAIGEDTLVSNFTTDEAGILMVIASIVPKVTYNTGTRRYLSHFVASGSQTDLANAVLQNVGNQPIYTYEIVGGKPLQASSSPTVFGYSDRFSEWMTMEDEVHGLLKDGETLDSFALQRSFTLASPPVLNSAFLQIPKNYLDQIMAVNVSASKFSAWCEVYFDYKVVQPLAEYSIPSLQDPAYEHGQTVTVNKNGGSL